MTMSLSTFCKFCDLDKHVIAKQCNGVAAENVTSCEEIFSLSGNLNNRVLATYPHDLEDHLVIFETN